MKIKVFMKASKKSSEDFPRKVRGIVLLYNRGKRECNINLGNLCPSFSANESNLPRETTSCNNVPTSPRRVRTSGREMLCELVVLRAVKTRKLPNPVD